MVACAGGPLDDVVVESLATSAPAPKEVDPEKEMLNDCEAGGTDDLIENAR